MFNELIKLVNVTKSVNAYGDVIEAQTERTVFAAKKSVTQSEFYQAQAVGLKPEIKFILADVLDYQNELLLKYKPFAGVEETYRIIRSYAVGTALELVCKKGVE